MPLDDVDTKRLQAMTVFSAAYIGIACGYVYSSYPYLARKAARLMNVTSR